MTDLVQGTQPELSPRSKQYEDNNSTAGYSRIFGATGQFLDSLLGQGQVLSNSSAMAVLNRFDFSCPQADQLITGYRAVGVPVTLNDSTGSIERVLVTRFQAREVLCSAVSPFLCFSRTT